MAHRLAPGGARPGAGRRKGSKNKRTLEYVRRAEATGIMPRDVMLEDMRVWYNEYQRLTGAGSEAEAREALRKSREAASAAAPYFHARYGTIEPQTVELSGPGGGPIPIETRPADTRELAKAIIEVLGKAAAT